MVGSGKWWEVGSVGKWEVVILTMISFERFFDLKKLLNPGFCFNKAARKVGTFSDPSPTLQTLAVNCLGYAVQQNHALNS